MKQFGSFIAFVVAIAALATAAFAFSAPAQAQDETYVDLSIEVVSSNKWTFTAKNNGTADAYGVTVDIELADQTIHSSATGQFKQNSGTSCSGNIPGTTCISGVWTVGFLGAGQEKEATIAPRLASGLPCCTGVSTNWSVPARVEIENTLPVEEDRFKNDNIDVGWISVSQNGGNTITANSNYWLEASVDDFLPDAGDTVNFSFKADMQVTTTLRNQSVHGYKLRLRLPPGMGTPTATPPSGTTFTAVTGLTRTWDWDIGSRDSNTALELVVSTTLDNPLPTGVTRSDLCLTAELTAHPDDMSPGDNSVEICFKEDPVVLLQEGQATLFSIHPCVGVTAYPCSSENTIEMRVIGDSAARAAGIARDEALLDPARVFVQVKDPEGCRIDTYSASVNSGTAPSWHTAREALSTIDNRAVGGVNVSYTILPFAGGQRANYTNLDRTVAAAGLDGATVQGLVKIRWPSDPPDAELTLSPSNPSVTLQMSYFPENDSDMGVWDRFVEFSTLGTYKLDFTAAVTHKNGTPSDTTDDVGYSGTGSYIFHVGPVSELGVSDGDGGLAPAGTRAFTIVAVNNGPDDAPAVEVAVTGLNASDYVSHSVTAGAFDSGTGVWTIGELRKPDYQQNIYGRDSEALTIITSAAVDTEITAAISNTQDYEVCIDSSSGDVALSSPSSNACTTEDATNTWHTTKYYDYISENNSAKIKAKDGTGAKLPSLRGAQSRAASVVVRWNPVAEVNGRKSTHYEVQKLPNAWTRVALEISYVDTGVAVGDTPRYRVRVINDRDQGGPWSAPLSVSVAPEPEPEPSNSSPRFTEGGSTTRHIQENPEPGTDVGSPVSATDRNRDRLTYELTGTDADSFEIVASSGQIRTKTELDYETKTRYRVTVSVSDGKNSRGEANENVDDVIDVTIAVTNQGEQGSITFSEALPVVGTEIEAELTDPDGGLSRVSWAWERSADGDAWAGIPGATSASYTPVDGDAGHYLRVTASYTDGHGPSKSATAALSGPVTALSISQRYDSDGDGSISLGEALKAAGDYRAGLITYDEAIAVANLYFESQSS